MDAANGIHSVTRHSVSLRRFPTVGKNLLTAKAKKCIRKTELWINRERISDHTWSKRTQQLGLLIVKKKYKIQILAVIAIALLLPLLSAYMDYYVLTAADLLSSCPKFENTDLDSFLFCKKQEFTASGDFSYTFWVGNSPIAHFSYLYYQATFPQLKAFVLRC